MRMYVYMYACQYIERCIIAIITIEEYVFIILCCVFIGYLAIINGHCACIVPHLYHGVDKLAVPADDVDGMAPIVYLAVRAISQVSGEYQVIGIK